MARLDVSPRRDGRDTIEFDDTEAWALELTSDRSSG